MNEPKKAEEDRQRLLHDLKEQVKELTALHYTARLLQDTDNDPHPAGVDQPAQQCGRLPGASGENHDCGSYRASDEAVPFEDYNKDHRQWAEIASDLLPKVFDIFMTTKTSGNGTGLGLAVCQEIVKEYGGKITISSQVERVRM